MVKFNQSAPGNKNVPEPKMGYEQRKVSFHKYKLAVTKGWVQRKDEDGRTYGGGDYILCERKIYNTASVENITDDAITIVVQKSNVTPEPNSINLLNSSFTNIISGSETSGVSLNSVGFVECDGDIDPVIVMSRLHESSDPVGSQLNQLDGLNLKNDDIINVAHYGRSIISSPEVIAAQQNLNKKMREIIDSNSIVEVIIEKDDNDTFLATTSTTPEAAGVGDTIEEAAISLKESIEVANEVKESVREKINNLPIKEIKKRKQAKQSPAK